MGIKLVILTILIYCLANDNVVNSLLNPHRPHEVEYLKEDVGGPLILTPLLEQNKTREAREASKVSLDGVANTIESYSGYFTVNKRFNSNQFFWFFPSKGDYKNDPVLLWLQGGPGVSSLFGLLTENGPIMVNKKSQLEIREHTWTNNHSVLYIDNPVGAGFSFTDNDNGYARNQTQVGNELYIALQQFFTLFPELRGNDFFITGESYAGKYIPALAHTIHKNNPTAPKKINLKGLAIGNGYIDPLYQKGYAQYLYQVGLVDLNTSRVIKKCEDKAVKYITEQKYLDAANAFEEVQEIMNIANGNISFYNYLEVTDPDSEIPMDIYLNKPETRQAIHVGNVTFGSKKAYANLFEDMPKSMSPWFVEAVNNYRVLLYTGQLDICVAYPLTLNLLKNIEFNDIGGYRKAHRKIWNVGKEIAGYSKTYGNFTEVLVRNAGHMVPTDQPKWAENMITSFTRNTDIGRNRQYSPIQSYGMCMTTK
ncbi:unnamed protein product [Acanthoscelides obtectus]|uniref:Carboxypeptidase n=1 Tax=Acanthoscelides obtectus TaxID=200917 RepID=A0A9P0L8Z6_ACAOB|nr:unnamed protein product [Acanthoscelides obtectus]CAK1666333.1 hypothetical protein AOBTE_LOCUS25262 [Acanthoscelides obtectus]